MDEALLLNKPCKLVKRDGFVLYGIPRDITPSYVLFETKTKTAYIGWIDIKELSEDGKQQGLNNG